jgi:peptidyl-prolyl cis-trans isomerase SurA
MPGRSAFSVYFYRNFLNPMKSNVLENLLSRLICSFFTGCLLLTVFSCKTPTKTTLPEPSVVARIGTKPIYSEEFQYVFNKNAPADSLRSAQKMREYLDLFVNFKLKVLEAEQMGLDTTQAFILELEGYRQQLAQPYLTEKSVTEQLIRQAYERMKEEIRASHLLLSLKEDADPEDTLAIYKRIMALRDSIIGGKKFSDMARRYSQDPSVASNEGDLGYFTGLQMVYPFEQVAFSMLKGQVSMPVRTRFGYHLIEVTDRRPSQGRVTVAHIMIRSNPEMPVEEARMAKQKIEEIYSRLQKGENWDRLCQQFSQDDASKNNGGVIRQFGTSELGLPAFEETAFRLEKPGDYSKPVQTPYGWHILRLVEKTSLPTFTEMEPSLRQKVSKDSRSEINKAAFLEKIKKDYQFTEFSAIQEKAFTKADSALLKGQWKYDRADKLLGNVLFSVKDKSFTVGDFFAFAENQQQPRPDLKPNSYMQNLYRDFVRASILKYEEAHLADKYADYRNLYKEYRDGILFFQRMQEEVWTKSLTDSVGAENYFNQNRQRYQWGQRATVTVYDAASQAVLDELKAGLSQKKFVVDIPDLDLIPFERNQATLSPLGNKRLQSLTTQLLKDTTLQIEVAAHADLREVQGISAKRGKALSQALRKAGVRQGQITLRDYGNSKPVSATQRQRNCRIELTLYSTSKAVLVKKLNRNDPLRLQMTEGTFQKGDNPYLDQLTSWTVDNFTVNYNGRVAYVDISQVEEPRPKTLQEARGQLISDYQQYLEKNWLERLKAKYPVTLNEEEVRKLSQGL